MPKACTQGMRRHPGRLPLPQYHCPANSPALRLRAAAAIARVKHPDAGSHSCALPWLQHIQPTIAGSGDVRRPRLGERQSSAGGCIHLRNLPPPQICLPIVVAKDGGIGHPGGLQRRHQAAPLLLVPAGGASQKAGQAGWEVGGRVGKARHLISTQHYQIGLLGIQHCLHRLQRGWVGCSG